MATADLPTREATDMGKLIALLNEYTGKLRSLSDRIMISLSLKKSKRFSLALAVVIGGCAALIAGLFLQSSATWNPGNILAVLISVMATGLAVVMMRERQSFQERLVDLIGHHRQLTPEELSFHLRDLNTLTEQVTRLISRASQLADHGGFDGLDERVEFDLRLTEAEIAVTYVNEIVLPATKTSRAHSTSATTA